MPVGPWPAARGKPGRYRTLYARLPAFQSAILNHSTLHSYPNLLPESEGARPPATASCGLEECFSTVVQLRSCMDL